MGCVVLVTLGLLSMYFVMREPTKPRGHRIIRDDVFSPGQTAYLTSDKVLAASKEALDRAQVLVRADDKAGVSGLIVTGLIRVVPIRSGVKIIQYDDGAFEVRILESSNKDAVGASGWVTYDNLTHSVPYTAKQTKD